MELIRTTESTCPVCLAQVDAQIVENDGSVHMLKSCKIHGPFDVLLSNFPGYYRPLSDFYFSLGLSKPLQNYYNLDLTSRCNLNCSMCMTNANKKTYAEPSLDSIRVSLKSFKSMKIGLWGGEPTMRDDLPAVIRMIRKSGNIPALYTNGIKLADKAYAQSLKDAGLEIVHLQFDGFDDVVYSLLRGRPLLSEKLSAISNLSDLGVPIVFESTIAKGVNESEVGKILDFALSNPNIKAALFRSYSALGNKGLANEQKISMEEIISLLDAHTSSRISLPKMRSFQKLMYVVYSLFSLPRCFYNHYFFLERSKGTFRPATELLDFSRIEPALDSYKSSQSIFSLLPAAPAFLSSPSLIYSAASLWFSRKILNKSFTSAGLSDRYLILGFGCICDPYNFDAESAKCCIGGEITLNKTFQSLAECNFAREKGEI
jgi:uncharacterized radical SAM superfamily Fe-S cluster-containing enzyme